MSDDVDSDPDEQDLCVACRRPATTFYPDDSGSPSCGRAGCELRIQTAKDYHDERGT